MPSSLNDYSTHVYALAEHVELRQDGWWEEALQLTTQFVLSTRPEGTKIGELLRQTESQLGSAADRHLIRDCINQMLTSGSIREEGHLIFLTEKTRQEYEAMERAANLLENENRDRYHEVIYQHVGKISNLPDWQGFCDLLLRPLIRELGAQTLNLVRGQTKLLRTHAQDVFLQQFSAEHKTFVEQLVVDFLDPSNTAVRRYILGHLNHYMLVSSSSLDKKTLDALRQNNQNRPTFHVILDTNIIFSILNLHFNPTNEAAQAFLDLSRTIEPYADVHLHVLAPTLDEGRDALKAARDLAPSGTVTGQMAEAAHSSGQISGLVRRYFEVAAERGGLSAGSYFEPYVEGMDLILEDLGVNLIMEGFEEIKDRKSFKDAVADWYSHEVDKTNGRSKAKITHDVLALEFIRNHRKRNPSSLAEAEWWFMTADFRLQSYEKRSLEGNRMYPKSVNPAELIQMLRFWSPRSDSLDGALVGAIRLPFSFYQFDDRMERTSLRILERMSRYSNAEDIPARVIERLLTDKVLRTSLENDSATAQEQDTAITIAVGVATSSLEMELDRKEQQIKELLSRAAAERNEAGAIRLDLPADKQAINQGIEVSKAKRLAELEQLKRQLEKERAAKRNLETKLKSETEANETQAKSLEDKLAELEKSAKEDRNADRVVIVWCVASAFLAWCAFELVRNLSMSVWLAALVWMGATEASLVVGLVLSKVAALPGQSRIVRYFGNAGRTLTTFIGAGIVSAVVAFAFVNPNVP